MAIPISRYITINSGGDGGSPPPLPPWTPLDLFGSGQAGYWPQGYSVSDDEAQDEPTGNEE